jgi:AcrR family transcriptional regulator
MLIPLSATLTGVSVPVTAEKPLRSDAQRNRDRIVVAARDVFGEHGLDAPVEEIARRAQVGVGTLYRRFPAKEDLIDAVFEDTLAELATIAREALAAENGWDGFRTYVERVVELNAANRGLHRLIGSHEHGRARIEAIRRKMRPLVGRVVARAQAEGTLRPDFKGQDIRMLFAATGRVIELTEGDAHQWRRFVGYLLDGLRVHEEDR